MSKNIQNLNYSIKLSSLENKYKSVLNGEIENNKEKIKNFKNYYIQSLAQAKKLRNINYLKYECLVYGCSKYFLAKNLFIEHLISKHEELFPNNSETLKCELKKNFNFKTNFNSDPAKNYNDKITKNQEKNEIIKRSSKRCIENEPNGENYVLIDLTKDDEEEYFSDCKKIKYNQIEKCSNNKKDIICISSDITKKEVKTTEKVYLVKV